MDLIEVEQAICGNTQLARIYVGQICVWPDPWTDRWDEGVPVFWERTWRDQWSVDPAPPAIEEV